MINSLPALRQLPKRNPDALLIKFKPKRRQRKNKEPRPVITFSEYIQQKYEQYKGVHELSTINQSAPAFHLPRIIEKFESPAMAANIKRNKFSTEPTEKSTQRKNKHQQSLMKQLDPLPTEIGRAVADSQERAIIGQLARFQLNDKQRMYKS